MGLPIGWGIPFVVVRSWWSMAEEAFSFDGYSWA
jgi:hypothetical protein